MTAYVIILHLLTSFGIYFQFINTKLHEFLHRHIRTDKPTVDTFIALSNTLQLLVIAYAGLSLHLYNQSQNVTSVLSAEHVGLSVITALPSDAIVLTQSAQMAAVLRHAQRRSSRRLDVAIFSIGDLSQPTVVTTLRNTYLNITFPSNYLDTELSAAVAQGQAFTLIQFLRSNIKRHKIYCTDSKVTLPDYYTAPSRLDSFSDALTSEDGATSSVLRREFALAPTGLLTQFVPHSKLPAPSDTLRAFVRFVRHMLRDQPNLFVDPRLLRASTATAGEGNVSPARVTAARRPRAWSMEGELLARVVGASFITRNVAIVVTFIAGDFRRCRGVPVVTRYGCVFRRRHV